MSRGVRDVQYSTEKTNIYTFVYIYLLKGIYFTIFVSQKAVELYSQGHPMLSLFLKNYTFKIHLFHS